MTRPETHQAAQGIPQQRPARANDGSGLHGRRDYGGPSAGLDTTWRDEVAFAENFVAGSPELGIRGTLRDGDTIALREVLVHMIEEYARRCGHADLLRERIDGRVGQ
jgi:hypothetical protein